MSKIEKGKSGNARDYNNLVAAIVSALVKHEFTTMIYVYKVTFWQRKLEGLWGGGNPAKVQQ